MAEWTSGVIYVTADPVAELEDWLDENCAGPWKTELVAIDDSVPGEFRKEIKILFADPADGGQFKGAFMASEEEQKAAEAERVEARAKQAALDGQRQNREVLAAARAGGKSKKVKTMGGMLQPDMVPKDWRSRN